MNREIGALSAQRLSDLIAAAIPSSVELGIMPLLVLTATAATAAGAAAAATAAKFARSGQIVGEEVC